MINTYTSDIFPYHEKIKAFASRITFNSMNVEDNRRVYEDAFLRLPTSFGKSVRYEVPSFACLTATGGLANEASTFYKKLASLLASKWDHPYSSTLCWLRCSLAFSLLRSAIQSIRGARSSCGHAIKTPTVVDLVNIESNISPGV